MQKNKDNQSLINENLEKAKSKGISHKEAAVLMECDIPEVTEQIKELAKRDQAEVLWQSYCHVCTIVLSNYCVQWMYLLPIL